MEKEWTMPSLEEIEVAFGPNACEVCRRPAASDDDWKSYEDGEGEHLCWGGPGCQESERFDDKKIIRGLLDVICGKEQQLVTWRYVIEGQSTDDLQPSIIEVTSGYRASDVAEIAWEEMCRRDCDLEGGRITVWRDGEKDRYFFDMTIEPIIQARATKSE